MALRWSNRRADNEVRDRKARTAEAAYLFMCSLAGNLPGFEEATRALYADDRKRYAEQVASWPEDVRNYALRLAWKRTAARLEARVRQRLLRYAHRPPPRDASCRSCRPQPAAL